MNVIFPRQLSVLLGCTVLATVGNGLSAQAQTVAPGSTEGLAKGSHSIAQPIPTPGTTATSAAAFTRVESPTSHSTTSVRVAQFEPNPYPSPGGETTPAPTDPTTPTTPTDPTTPIPTTPTTPTAPTTPTTPTTPTVGLADVDPNYWAYGFIQPLTAAGVIAGFPDGSFRPEQPVTRAEFAAMIQKAFGQQNPVRQLPPGGFTDVPSNYWGAAAIQQAYETGFMAGYPDNTFLPNQQIPKVEAIQSLASGLGLTASGAADILNTYYTDAAQIPPYAVNAVVAATQANVVVNYPSVNTLNPQVPLTRAEAAAHLHQALVRLGKVPPVPSNVAAASYIVGNPTAVGQATPTTPTTPEQTAPTETPTPDQPTRASASGSNYVGVGANFGLTGDSDLGDGVNLAVFSKIGITRAFSVRPAAVVTGGNPSILIPITYNFNFQPEDAFGQTFSFSPYAGAGVGINTGDDTNVGFLLTGGVDVPLTRRFTATAAVNALFGNDTDVGVWVGVGYNFTGF